MRPLRLALESFCIFGMLCVTASIALVTWPYWLWKARRDEAEERRRIVRGGYWDHP